MKNILKSIAILAVIVMAFGGPVSTVKAATTLAPTCSVNAEGEQVCYNWVDPQYTDPTYECPAGSTPVPGDPAHCTVDTSGYVYAPRPWIPATYICPNGYEEVSGGPKPCRKLLDEGYWNYAPQPSTEVCPGPITWSYTYQGVTYTITFSYDKDDKDPHKCHRPSDNNTPPSSWPGYVRGRFNQENPEFLPAQTVYGTCENLGTGWEDDPATEHQCRKWNPPTYDYVDKVVDVEAHYGDCSSLGDGWEQGPSENQCQKYSESGYVINAIVVGGTAYCSIGDLIDGKCRVVVECPPPPPHELTCKELIAKYHAVGWNGLTVEEKKALKACPLHPLPHLPKSGGEGFFETLLARFGPLPLSLMALAIVGSLAFLLRRRNT